MSRHKPRERLTHFGFSLYWLERRAELVGKRLRKPHRDSAAVQQAYADRVYRERTAQAMYEAFRRLERAL